MGHEKVPTHHYVLTKKGQRVYKAVEDREHDVVLLRQKFLTEKKMDLYC